MVDFNNLHILFVEDNIFQARLTITLVESHLHSTIRHVTTLKDALEFLNQHKFDVILLDLYLPDASGLHALTTVQRHSPLVPIIVITGREDQTIAQEAVESGAQDFIQKANFEPDLLRRSIRYAILRHQTQMELRTLKEREMEELRRSLQHLESVNWDGIPTHGHDISSVPKSLQDRNPYSFELLKTHYESLLLEFLQRVFTGKSILGIGKSLGKQLMQLNANPNDVNEIHLSAMQDILVGKTPEEKKGILIDGRMFALEVMGNLAEAYRAEYLGNKKLTE